jgi:hypothetical protein
MNARDYLGNLEAAQLPRPWLIMVRLCWSQSSSLYNCFSLLFYIYKNITCFVSFFELYTFARRCTYFEEPGERSRYSDWLLAGRPRGQSSNPSRVKNFLFTSSRPALEPT